MSGFVDVFRKLWGWLSTVAIVIGPGPLVVDRLDFTHAPTDRLDLPGSPTDRLDFVEGR